MKNVPLNQKEKFQITNSLFAESTVIQKVKANEEALIALGFELRDWQLGKHKDVFLALPRDLQPTTTVIRLHRTPDLDEDQIILKEDSHACEEVALSPYKEGKLRAVVQNHLGEKRPSWNLRYKLPSKHFPASSEAIVFGDLPKALQKKCFRLLKQHAAIEAEAIEFAEKLFALVNTAKTAAQLEEYIPGAEKHFPKSIEEKMNPRQLPAVSQVLINEVKEGLKAA